MPGDNAEMDSDNNAKIDFKLSKEKRCLVRRDVTKTTNYIEEKFNDLDTEDKQNYLSRLEEMKLCLDELNESILEFLIKTNASEADTDSEYDRSSEYSCKISQYISKLKAFFPVVSSTNNNQIMNHVKLPQIPLPEYGHNEDEDLLKFLNNF